MNDNSKIRADLPSLSDVTDSETALNNNALTQATINTVPVNVMPVNALPRHQRRQRGQTRDNLMKWLLISIGALLSVLILVVPLLAIFLQAFATGLLPVWQTLRDAEMLHAIWLTVLIALITVPVNLLFGLLLAWLISRFRFPGRQLLLTLTDIPFAVSPVVAGLLFLLCYGANGIPGGWLSEHNIQLMFSWQGMLLVTIFVTCPFVVREVLPVMQSQGSQQDEAAISLGASGWQMFRRVTLPAIRPALLYGVVLTCARAIGEFGAVSVVSGSIRGETLTLPLQIELYNQDYNTTGAFTAATLLAIMAILTLFLQALLQNKRQQHKRQQHQPANEETDHEY